MCRWMGYLGEPINVGLVLFREDRNTIVHQSLDASQGAEPVNGDGFGVGWFVPDSTEPSRYRSTEPAWNDENLREITNTLASPAFIAHVRAAIGSPVQQSNCHPFRHDGVLFVHNGFIRDFGRIKRDVVLAVDPDLYPQIVGSTDSEHLFYLALTFGLQDDPHTALERMVGLHRARGRRGRGRRPGADVGRGADAGRAGGRALCDQLGAAHALPQQRHRDAAKDASRLRGSSPGAAGRARVMSEPLGTLPGAWTEVPISSAVHLTRGDLEVRGFTPRAAAS